MVTSDRFTDLLEWNSTDDLTRRRLLEYSRIIRAECYGYRSIQEYLKSHLDGGSE